jgi:cell division protein FtsL
MGLVASRYRARSLIAEGEIARQDGKSLEAEGTRLRSELGRHSQPATVEAAARASGLRPIAPDRTVLLAARAGEAPATPAAEAP